MKGTPSWQSDCTHSRFELLRQFVSRLLAFYREDFNHKQVDIVNRIASVSLQSRRLNNKRIKWHLFERWDHTMHYSFAFAAGSWCAVTRIKELSFRIICLNYNRAELYLYTSLKIPLKICTLYYNRVITLSWLSCVEQKDTEQVRHDIHIFITVIILYTNRNDHRLSTACFDLSVWKRNQCGCLWSSVTQMTP